MLLQPNEDLAAKQLVYRCRNCTFQRPTELPKGGLPHLNRIRGGESLTSVEEMVVTPEVAKFVEENCVHRRDVSFIAKEDIVVPEGVIYDPSLARRYFLLEVVGRREVFVSVALLSSPRLSKFPSATTTVVIDVKGGRPYSTVFLNLL